ncbi:MAG: hypothetical protein MK165_05625 [Pirellulaceae bacterium]|nr:hypothetical protein [Pirellulaceae bacterium]
MRDATADAQNPVYLKAKLEEGSWRVADEMAELLIGTVTETLYAQWDCLPDHATKKRSQLKWQSSEFQSVRCKT